jgi:hypothetical protein
MIEELCLLKLELECLEVDEVVGGVRSTDGLLRERREHQMRSQEVLGGVVSREPNTLQWDRVEAWWSSEDLCLLRSACGGWGISTQKKKLNVTEADRSTTPRAWGRVPGVRFESGDWGRGPVSVLRTDRFKVLKASH